MNSARTGYFYDCNSQSLTALQVLKATLQNPAGSGKKIIVEGYAIPNMANVAMMGTLRHMPTGNLPSTVYAPLPYIIGTDISSPGNVGVFKANVAVAIGGTFTGGTDIITIPVKGSDRNFIEAAPIVLMPGVTIGFQFNPGLIVASVTFAVYTREEDI